MERRTVDGADRCTHLPKERAGGNPAVVRNLWGGLHPRGVSEGRSEIRIGGLSVRQARIACWVGGAVLWVGMIPFWYEVATWYHDLWWIPALGTGLGFLPVVFGELAIRDMVQKAVSS